MLVGVTTPLAVIKWPSRSGLTASISLAGSNPERRFNMKPLIIPFSITCRRISWLSGGNGILLLFSIRPCRPNHFHNLPAFSFCVNLRSLAGGKSGHRPSRFSRSPLPRRTLARSRSASPAPRQPVRIVPSPAGALSRLAQSQQPPSHPALQFYRHTPAVCRLRGASALPTLPTTPSWCHYFSIAAQTCRTSRTKPLSTASPEICAGPVSFCGSPWGR